MQRDDVKNLVRERISPERYLKKSTGGNYCCPFPGCGSGTGPHHTGALHWYKETKTFHCFSCGKTGDVIDLHMNEYGLDFNAALEDLARELGETIDPWRPATAQEDFQEEALSFNGKGDAAKRKASKVHQEGPGSRREAAGVEEHAQSQGEALEAPEIDYTAYYRACVKRLEDPRAKSYLEGRGISVETAARFWVGFDPAADPARSGYPSARMIIPTTKGHYVGRAIDPETPPKYAKMNVKGGKPGLFNERALYAQDAGVVFIVEGAFDALSLEEVGRQAVALNSTNNVDRLIKRLEEAQKAGTITGATFALCLDNDEAGRRASQVLRDGMSRLNVPFIVADVSTGCKDPNEALVRDREAFSLAVSEAVRRAGSRPDNVRDYIASFMAADIRRFGQERKTGFKNLDAVAGGLYGGLYCLAAISSLGKTTFAAQMADQLAESGNDVLFFSMEQSRLELVTKSISRTVAQKTMREGGFDFVSSLAIRKGYLPETVLRAAEEYSQKVEDRLSIVEGNFNCTISFIGEYVRGYARKTGKRPVVFIDYLQILQGEPDGKRAPTTKEIVDRSVTELKRISRELDIPVIVISSVNRANYLAPIDFESLKESGGIEYSCDVVWGLQLQCLHEDVFTGEKLKDKRDRVKKAKAEDPRKIELCCLKNRYGRSSYECFFDYYPSRDLFVEDAGNEFSIVVNAMAQSQQKKPKRL